MEKSVFSQDYDIFLALLRTFRRSANLTQQEVAERLGQTQSFISKCERGERRIDIIELSHFCQAIGIPLNDFIEQLNKATEESHR